ncbi:MAG: hypothetical protein WCO42_11665, partial [bacterium]
MPNKRLLLGFAVALFLVAGLGFRLALFGASCANVPAFDDECIIGLQAKAIMQGNFSLFMWGQPYLFPLSAYILAPLMEFLPRTAFGARIMVFMAGLVTTFAGCLLAWRWGSIREIWPGLALMLVGSSFLLILLSGMALPGYAELLVLSAIVVGLAQHSLNARSTPWGLAWMAGVLAGLACSVTMLAAPVLVMSGLMIGLQHNWRTARWTAPAYLGGAIVGLVPHMLAKSLFPKVAGDIYVLETWRDALQALVSPVLHATLPAAFGIGCPIVPGHQERLG